MGARIPKGYGHARWNGVLETTHRLQWQAARGPIPPGLNVLHKCDNPPCRRQRHLFLGTQKHNIWDAKRKGRHRGRGKRPGEGKYMDSVSDHVRKLTARRNALGITQRALDEMVGVSNCMIAKWESGQRHPTAQSLIKWAKALGLRVELVQPTTRKREKAS
jgi:ribosome-binding protein aMBF1 (putative translation factor)